MNKEMKVVIRGKNNEKIQDVLFLITNTEEFSDEWKNLAYKIRNNKDLKCSITEKFLTKMEKKKLKINSSEGVNKDNHHRLWNPDFNGHSYFGGVVGVVEDDLIIHIDIENEKIIDPEYDDFEYDDFEYDDFDNATKIKLKIKLQIQSRFDNEKPYFLATMLLRDKIKLNDNMVPSDEDDLYDYMLLFWYKTKLHEAYLKGVYKTYRRFEGNNDRLKGTIEIAKHIKLNVGQNNGKIAYSYRENTVNNYLNHMIVLAYEYLKKKYPDLVENNFDNDVDLKQIIEGLKCEIEYDSSDSKAIISKNNKAISHPYYTEYEDLRLICIKILRDEGISIWAAEDEKTKSILFYIPDLWELYLEEIMRSKTTDTEIKAQEKHEIYGDIEDKTKYVQKTYPDFVFYDGEKPFMVLDAKFRKGWETSLAEDGKSKLSDLSDYDKCIRDMNSIGANATGIIYPTNQPPKYNERYSERSICHTISEYNKTDMFYTFPVYVPKTEEKTVYTDWKKEFDKNVDESMNIMVQKVEYEKAYAKRLEEYKSIIPFRDNL